MACGAWASSCRWRRSPWGTPLPAPPPPFSPLPALLWVMPWHYAAPVYAASFPYGAAYAWIPVLDHGWAGVNLFFLISGYVILLTLERCSGFAGVMARRWLRLVPALLIGA